MVFQLDISNNQLCGLHEYGRGTYTAEGITAIADALRVNGALTSINLSGNGWRLQMSPSGLRVWSRSLWFLAKDPRVTVIAP
jgi:hypothetical protein